MALAGDIELLLLSIECRRRWKGWKAGLGSSMPRIGLMAAFGKLRGDQSRSRMDRTSTSIEVQEIDIGCGCRCWWIIRSSCIADSRLASDSGSAGVPKGTVAIENESYLEVIPALIKRDHTPGDHSRHFQGSAINHVFSKTFQQAFGMFT